MIGMIIDSRNGLMGVTKKSSRFVCVIVFAEPVEFHELVESRLVRFSERGIRHGVWVLIAGMYLNASYFGSRT